MIHRGHHLNAEDSGSVPVYFLRPHHRFMGVTGRPISIELDGEEFLDLAREDYTLARLIPGEYRMVVASWAVKGSDNQMVRATSLWRIELEGPDPVYLTFIPDEKGFWETLADQYSTVTVPVAEGSPGVSISVDLGRPPEGFIVRSVNHATALAIASDLTPVGAAVEMPVEP